MKTFCFYPVVSEVRGSGWSCFCISEKLVTMAGWLQLEWIWYSEASAARVLGHAAANLGICQPRHLRSRAPQLLSFVPVDFSAVTMETESVVLWASPHIYKASFILAGYLKITSQRRRQS